MECVLSSAYLGCVQYYTKLLAYDSVLMERCDNYIKQTFRNRCYISTTSGPQALTIPTVKFEGDKCQMRDIIISDHGEWRHQHWTALVSAYQNSPFFEYYMDDFRPFYEKKWKYLFDFNEELRELVCSLLSISPKVNYTDSYATPEENDFRQMISPKVGFEWDNSFRPLPYYQVFSIRQGFQPNMSIVDLLFNMGPEGLLVLRDSVVS